MTSVRPLLRLARRDARRDRWRTVLVIVMVALPVAAMVGAITLLDTLRPDPHERATGVMGRADAVAYPRFPSDDPIAELPDRLPDDLVVEPIASRRDLIVVDGRARAVTVTDERLDPEALSAGRVRLVDGREPRGADEVAVTRAVRDDAALSIGDPLFLDALGTVSVVGIAERPEQLSDRSVHVAAGQLDGGDIGQVLLRSRTGTWPVIVDQDVAAVQTDDDTAGSGGARDWFVDHRDNYLAGERGWTEERSMALLLAGLAVVEVALIAGAAFAVSVRRRQRELGLIAAVGGTSRHVRQAVMLTGLTTGILGAVAGVLVGIGGLIAVSPWLDQLGDRRTGGLALDAGWLLASAGTGVLAAWLGAFLPARSVARLPVTVALSGRRPDPHPSFRGLLLGLLTLVAGTAILLYAAVPGRVRVSYGIVGAWMLLLGCVAVVLGAGLTSPWLLERLGRLAPRLPAGPRLALRDAARFRSRNGPIVTASMAALAASVTVASALGAVVVAERDSYRPAMSEEQAVVNGDAALVERMGQELGAEPVAIDQPEELDVQFVDAQGVPRQPWEYGLQANAAVGTPALAHQLAGPAAVDALARGDAVLIGEALSEDPAASLPASHTALVRPAADRRAELREPLELPLVRLEGGGHGYRLPALLLPPEAVAALDVPVQNLGFLLTLDEPAAPAVDRFLASSSATGAVSEAIARDEVFIDVERGPDRTMALLRNVLVGLGLLTGLITVAVAIALASVEARRDLVTLTAVGAGRRTRRSLAAGRALVLAGLAGVLAIPVGMIPAVLLSGGFYRPWLGIHVPWITFALVALGVPAAAMLGAVLGARREPSVLTRAA